MGDSTNQPTSFLGRGWSFPPEFVKDTGDVVMTEGEADIEASLRILFSTQLGERFLVPGYGLDMHELLFEPMSTTMRTFLQDRIKLAILIYEPRINPISLDVSSPQEPDGTLLVALDYVVRATNSRYNLVFPFYWTDAAELPVASIQGR
jgi:phage baseplate assembly protein W